MLIPCSNRILTDVLKDATLTLTNPNKMQLPRELLEIILKKKWFRARKEHLEKILKFPKVIVISRLDFYVTYPFSNSLLYPQEWSESDYF